MVETTLNRVPLKVFVVGAPRSGTSILLYALKEVFDLPGFGESHVIPVFQRMVHPMRVYLESFTTLNDPVMVKTLSRARLEQCLFEFVRAFYRETFPGDRWVDKTPTGEAVFGLPLIESIFPDVRLIVTKRNGIEVVGSHVKKFNSSFEEACLSWVNAMKGLLHARGICRNLLEVDQYEFLNVPEQVSERIARHLSALDRAGKLASYLLNHRVESSSTHDSGTRLRLADTNWSGADRELFKLRCAEMMTTFGYEL
jgi:hypothetical protein